ncbi:alkaline phosphatase D family protein [Thalassoroseus pseudoceratinae]|uniref:alkaline phosphatase D family protein n=1 Tax=Thalassoroseus pseudoceratinae TaxID=2713176 RepID=UPI0014234FEC|nr:alkaline phosphatase D family protein [Thalassoroseus pseudoceratinae]
MSYELNRRSMLAMTTAALLSKTARAAGADSRQPVGPMVGHVNTTTAKLWFRPTEPGSYQLSVLQGADGQSIQKIVSTASAENDLCLTWNIPNLQPDTRYEYRISSSSTTIVEGADCWFKTAPDTNSPSRVCLAFGSCADNNPLQIWSQMEKRGAQGLVLLGDTPYIDSTNLATARRKHREFLSVPPLAALVRHTPTWGTWDDHDFGRNDSDGRLKGKENTRRAFVEYRANQEFGHEGEGIYTKFRSGPVEVFLLDTRWFARTERSPVDPDKSTLLGHVQWKWLQESLLASTAPFKVIACGMIWDDKENTESDDWGTYTHEREALFQFLGEKKIGGVVLIGGDIHCSRLLRYPTEKQVGYPIHQFIVSPIHNRTIPALNVAHPHLVRGEAVPHVWLRLVADTTQSLPTLHAEWVQMNGRKMWDIKLTKTELS